MALSRAKEEFAFLVSSATGLSRETVRAWVQAEGGRDDNPLNIRRRDGGFGGYGSARAAAAATVRLLNSNPSYRPILRIAAAPNATIQQELRAIIESPWAEGRYTTPGSRTRGNILRGAYAALYPRSPAATTQAVSGTPADFKVPFGGPSVPFPGPDLYLTPWGPMVDPRDIPGVDGATDALTGWVGDLTRWLGENAATAFLYVALTAVGAGVIVLGLMRSTGTRPANVAAAVAMRRLPTQGRDIPF